MPWCETCHRFLSQPTVQADGTCPTCGHPVEGRSARTTATADRDADGVEERPALPWHLWLLAAAVVVYLGFRAWQGIEWVIHSL
jgi:PHP family Zn ribbon phosphoesterase